MNPEDLERLFHTFDRSAFRLEQLPYYRADDESVTAWREGRPLPDFTVDTSPWLRLIADTTAAGHDWSRVHIVDQPLNEYTRFRLATDHALVEAGERHYVADRAWHAGLNELREDFWMLDDGLVIRMLYDADGDFIRGELAPDGQIDGYRVQRDLALRWAVPLDRFPAEAQRRTA